MKRTIAIVAMAMVAAGNSVALSDDVIRVFLSYNIVLDPADGSRPDDGDGNEITNAQINESIDEMNALMETYFRGYRFERFGAIREIGGMGQPNGPSQWYDTDFFGANGASLKDQMQADAEASPNAYNWRDDTINIYMTNGICGGICSFPDDGDEIVIIGGCSSDNGPLHLHELGHYFDLCHTQGCPCGSCGSGTGLCNTVPDDDEMADTLPDLQCWDQDDISNWSFGVDYDVLSSVNRQRVDDTFFNIMSYHPNEVQLTELQLDRWSDTANGVRDAVVDGRMIFAESSPLLGDGSSEQPYNTLQRAVNAASALRDDVIVLRPGSFSETIVIDKQLTLRATRNGSVIIGAGSLPSLSEPMPFEDVLHELIQKQPKLLEKSPATTLDFAGE